MPDQPLRDRIRTLERRLSVEPDNVGLRQELLRCHERYLDEAREGGTEIQHAFEANLEVLYALSPRDPVLCDVLARAVDGRYGTPGPDDPEAAEHYRAGRAHLAAGRLEAAEEELIEALLAAPESGAVHRELAALYVRRRDWAAASPHLEFAHERQRDCAPMWALSGELAAGQGRLEVAFEHCIRALELNPLCATAEAHLAALGPSLGYRWLSLPLRPLVVPLIEADGRSRIVVRPGASRAAQAAWRRWAQTVIRQCRRLDEDQMPRAGLPRSMPVLGECLSALTQGWRRARRWRWTRRRDESEALLDWLVGVERAGLAGAYLFYSYLHPDLGSEYRRWSAAEPESMRRFLTDFVAWRGPLGTRWSDA